MTQTSMKGKVSPSLSPMNETQLKENEVSD